MDGHFFIMDEMEISNHIQNIDSQLLMILALPLPIYKQNIHDDPCRNRSNIF